MSNKKIIRNGQIESDTWLVIKADSEGRSILPDDGDIIVPLSLWQEQAQTLKQRAGKLGIWLNSDESPESIATDLENFQIIAINFPVFMDGRGYSYARLLRERFGYKGEIRAIGDVMQDQLFYMRRCGIDSFTIKEGKDIEEAISGLYPINQSYQAAADQPQPLFRRR